jgi:hypothetical protein
VDKWINSLLDRRDAIEQIRRARADFEAESREPVTAETFDWLWERLHHHLGSKGVHSLQGIGELGYRVGRQWIRPVQPAAPYPFLVAVIWPRGNVRPPGRSGLPPEAPAGGHFRTPAHPGVRASNTKIRPPA